MFQQIKKELYNGLGFVEIIDMMPREVPTGRTADIAIARNARVSYGLEDRSPEQDEKLIKYLYTHKHTSPFESVVFKFRIRCPIFVERQLVRHRTASINEISYRYTTPREEFYLPELRKQAQINKQCSEAHEFDSETVELWNNASDLCARLFENYQQLISRGVAREVARCCLPVSLMTEMMWQMNLHNLLHFLRLRRAGDAQKEIRILADAIFDLIKPYVPVTCAIFEESLH